jgi:hypothetical protein
MGAACAHNLVLLTSVGYKFLKIDTGTANGIKTTSQVIVKEVQLFCNEEDART